MHQDNIEQNIIALAKKTKKPVISFIQINREKAEDSAITEKHLFQLRYMFAHQKFDELQLVIYTRGGDLHAAGMIADLLRSTTDVLKGYIPHNIYSAGTLIALACNEIVMGDNSTIGPLDPQIEILSSKNLYASSLDIFRGLEEINQFAIDSFGQVHVKIRELTHDKLDLLDELKLASEFATSLASKLARDLTAQEIGYKKRVLQMSADHLDRVLRASGAYSLDKDSRSNLSEIDRVVKRLVYSYNNHGYPITREEAKEIGIPVVDASEAEQQLFDTIALDIVHTEEDVIFLYDPKLKKITTPDMFCL